MKSVIRWISILSSLIAWGIVAAQPPAARVTVTTELERLMAEHGFAVRGIEQTVDAMARVEGDELLSQLRALLENFDYVLVQNAEKGVEQVIILGEKVAYVPPPMVIDNEEDQLDQDADPDADPDAEANAEEIVLPTQRKGASHLLTLTLEGANARRMQQSLLIDTGADRVVLPASLIAPLGLDVNALRDQQVQTANGTVAARVGKVPALWLGETRIPDVAAAFIEDRQLGGQALLGMNVLGRFRMTIDDANSQVTLASK